LSTAVVSIVKNTDSLATVGSVYIL